MCCCLREEIREFKIYDATVAKTSLKNGKFKFFNLFRHCVSLFHF